MKNYENILLICGDYPSYGGSATDCNNLSEFLRKEGKNTYEIYFNYDDEINKKYYIDKDKIILDRLKLDSFLSNIKFKPDIIVLKSAIHLDLKKYFECKVIFVLVEYLQIN